MNWSYIFKHWSCTLLLGSTISALVYGFESLSPSEISKSLVWFLIYLIFSIIYSIPTLIVYFLAFYMLSNMKIDIMWIKFILILITVTGITLTTLLYDPNTLEKLTMYYALSAIVSGILFRLKRA